MSIRATLDDHVDDGSADEPCRVFLLLVEGAESADLDEETVDERTKVLRKIELNKIFCGTGSSARQLAARVAAECRADVAFVDPPTEQVSAWLHDLAMTHRGDTVLILAEDMTFAQRVLNAVTGVVPGFTARFEVASLALSFFEVGPDGRGVLHLLNWDDKASWACDRVAEHRPDRCQVILVRHGQAMTVENGGQVWSHHPVGLTPLGRAQAARLAQQLGDVQLSAAYTSDLARAQETADAIVTGRSISSTIDQSFREIALGDFEGTTMDEIKQKGLREYLPWLEVTFNQTFPTRLFHHGVDLAFPGGESIREVHERVRRSFNDLVMRHQGEAIAIVAHTWVIQPLLATIAGAPIDDYFRFNLRYATVTLAECGVEAMSLASVNSGMDMDDLLGGRLQRISSADQR